ncbi:hypothetical protein A5791_17970 [Mycobacterium sp. 852002-51163_SCH5372311]|nr:hypothetical protein A5791_17970 [Mycobacterium sp. 852002-51163_SCH5372311]
MKPNRHLVLDGKITCDRGGARDPEGEAKQVVACRGDCAAMGQARRADMPLIERTSAYTSS